MTPGFAVSAEEAFRRSAETSAESALSFELCYGSRNHSVQEEEGFLPGQNNPY